MGTSVLFQARLGTSEDHPHACGDKMDVWILCASRLGSSPRVWGQVTAWSARYDAHRIIPTRVGTRRLFLKHIKANGDHPHACGDKRPVLHRIILTVGSSPRVWGQEYLRTEFRDQSGIIPTRVGTSIFSTLPFRRYRDHPHACGDKEKGFRWMVYGRGSSPRVWGQD